MISARFPGDGFLGEEFGDTPGTTGYRWIIDPIDGTRCFVRNIPHWATLIGLEYKGEMIAGVSYAPADKQLFPGVARRGNIQERPAGTRFQYTEVSRVSGVLFGHPVLPTSGQGAQFLNIMRGVDRARGFGDYYGFVLVAQGSCDLMVDYGVHIWDIAGLKVIVEEAGGALHGLGWRR